MAVNLHRFFRGDKRREKKREFARGEARDSHMNDMDDMNDMNDMIPYKSYRVLPPP